MKRTFFTFALVFATCTSLNATPWGKDADLASLSLKNASQNLPRNDVISTPILGVIAEVLIDFHQSVISPADGPRSSYLPSSSQYTMEAMRRYGFMKGWILGCDRLMRENDDTWHWEWVSDGNGTYLKYDPVP